MGVVVPPQDEYDDEPTEPYAYEAEQTGPYDYEQIAHAA